MQKSTLDLRPLPDKASLGSRLADFVAAGHDYAAYDGGWITQNTSGGISRLFTMRLETNDLRWLVRMGYLQHAREITRAKDKKRRFASSPNTAFMKTSCFLLTEAGYSIAGSDDAGADLLPFDATRSAGCPAAAALPTAKSCTPRWDREAAPSWSAI